MKALIERILTSTAFGRSILRAANAGSAAPLLFDGVIVGMSAGAEEYLTATNRTMGFDTVIAGNAAYFNTGTFKFTAPATGHYLVDFRMVADNAGWNPAVRIDGTDTFYLWDGNNLSSATLNANTTVALTAAQTLEIRLYNASGVTRNVYGDVANRGTQLAIRRIR